MEWARSARCLWLSPRFAVCRWAAVDLFLLCVCSGSQLFQDDRGHPSLSSQLLSQNKTRCSLWSHAAIPPQLRGGTTGCIYAYVLTVTQGFDAGVHVPIQHLIVLTVGKVHSLHLCSLPPSSQFPSQKPSASSQLNLWKSLCFYNHTFALWMRRSQKLDSPPVYLPASTSLSTVLVPQSMCITTDTFCMCIVQLFTSLFVNARLDLQRSRIEFGLCEICISPADGIIITIYLWLMCNALTRQTRELPLETVTLVS